MRKNLFFLLVFLSLIVTTSCYNSDSRSKMTKEQEDSIAQVNRESTRVADSIARINRIIADSIAKVDEAKKQAVIQKAKKNFRYKNDEFENRSWVFHNTTPRYTNRNSVHLYFQQNSDGSVSNLRFRVQYENEDWLFIDNIIFNIDGENETFIPDRMERDNDSRIWEWCDEPASLNKGLIVKIANAKKVKLKLNGRQYYDTRTMNSGQIKAFKETLDFYYALGGSL